LPCARAIDRADYIGASEVRTAVDQDKWSILGRDIGITTRAPFSAPSQGHRSTFLLIKVNFYVYISVRSIPGASIEGIRMSRIGLKHLERGARKCGSTNFVVGWKRGA
jgi:hypothetical protein